MKTKLSVAIATYNEENNIVDCLESVKDLADEIVVVDGMSHDRTAQLAKKLGARVIRKPNRSMFHINKNIAIRNCTGDWILVLDADEQLSSELTKEITRVISTDPPENGFWINRRNWFLGDFLKKGGAYPDPVIRLFKKGKGYHPEISVHEQIKIDGKIGRLEEDILHFADPSFKRYLERANRYTERTAIDFGSQGLKKNPLTAIYFMLFKPTITFLLIYFRHKGYQDGFRGFVWALFSGAHFFYAYSKYSTKK